MKANEAYTVYPQESIDPLDVDVPIETDHQRTRRRARENQSLSTFGVCR